MTVSLRGLGATPCTSSYPSSITFAESLECAFAPWTDTCKRLKSDADLECAIYTGEISKPPAPPVPAVPSGALTPGLDPRTPQEIQDEIIAGTNAEYQARVDAWIAYQAAQAEAAAQRDREACGTFSSLNAATGACNFDPSKPAFLLVIGIGLVALMILKKARVF